MALADYGKNAEREDCELEYSDLQRQAAQFESSYRTRAGAAGPQSKVPVKATTVAPDGFCVVSDLLWREPEGATRAVLLQPGINLNVPAGIARESAETLGRVEIP